MMSAPVSVVIPTLNEARRLPACLASLLDGALEGLVHEVIVADAGSSDATCRIADQSGARLVQGAAGRGAQIRAGIAVARAPWVLILHADSRLQAEWPEAAWAHIRNRPDDGGYFWLRFDAPGVPATLVARWANLRSRLFGMPYGDQGLLVSRRHLEGIGGYPALPLMEDVVVARALRPRLAPLGAVLLTSAERYQGEGWLRRGARNLALRVRFALGARPEELQATYRRDGKTG